MKIKILASMLAGALAMLPVTANAGWGGGGVGPYGDPITIYGWQNHTYEIIEKGANGIQTNMLLMVMLVTLVSWFRRHWNRRP